MRPGGLEKRTISAMGRKTLKTVPNFITNEQTFVIYLKEWEKG